MRFFSVTQMSERKKKYVNFDDRTLFFSRSNFCSLATVVHGQHCRARPAASKPTIMEKLFFHLPNLIGKAIKVDAGSFGTIESFTTVRWCQVVLKDGSLRRMSVAGAVEGYFDALSKSKASGTPNDIKHLAVAALERMQAHKYAVAQARKSVVLNKRKRGHLDAHFAQEEALRAAQGLQLPECNNKHTMASLEAQFATLEAREEGGQETLESLGHEASFVFHTWDDLLAFFEEHGVGFSKNLSHGGPRARALSPRVSSLRSTQRPSRC
jgi:hypothetical protein